MNNWQQEGWKEAPVPVWNMLNYVALQEGRNGMAVFSEGLREFEVIGEEKKTFAITLLRGVGLLGKEDLLLRPGRPSGIKMPVGLTTTWSAFLSPKFIELYRYANRRWCSSAGASMADSSTVLQQNPMGCDEAQQSRIQRAGKL